MSETLGMSPPAGVQPIREEIRVLPASAQEDGSPAWQLLDPVRNRFFRLGWLEFELLLRWGLGNPMAIAESVTAETTLSATSDDVEILHRFLQHHELIQLPVGQSATYLERRVSARQGGFLTQLLQHYLFIRLPLLHPEHWLKRVERLTRFLYGSTFWISTGIAGVLGGMLVLRQLDTVGAKLSDSMNVHGVLSYTIALLLAKSLHELGHAITATRYGVRVAHMGVALVVMAPMLYTDTGESWKLINHRNRLNIAVAGVATEMLLAVWATLAWALLPECGLRSSLFFLATTSWVLSVLINASPFMRFDGYFVLADALNLPNLHERSAALARRRFRSLLFGFSEPDPEFFPKNKARLLAFFSAFTWLYRMTVFLGIALAVYHYFFKVLGVFLFAVEMAWFIVLPIWRELKEWPQLSSQVSSRRKGVYGGIIIAFLVAVFWPWSHVVTAPGWVFPINQRVIYSPQAARIVAIHTGDVVEAGEMVLELDVPELQDNAQRSTILGEAYRHQSDHLPAQSESGEALSAKALQQSREMMQQALEHTHAAERLRWVAPFAGQIVDRVEGVQVGTWVTPQQPLARLVDKRVWRAELLVPEQELSRLAVGQSVNLYSPRQPSKPLIGRIVSIDTLRVTTLPHPMLDARSGGSIVTYHEQNRDIAIDALYRVGINLPALSSDHSASNTSGLMGKLPTQESVYEGRIEAAPQSIWQRWIPTLFAVLVRESGF